MKFGIHSMTVQTAKIAAAVVAYSKALKASKAKGDKAPAVPSED